jgi:hypothetical protein
MINKTERATTALDDRPARAGGDATRVPPAMLR